MKDIKLIMENWRSFLTEEKVSHSIPRVEILSALADDVSNYGEHDAALNEESLEEEKMSGKKIAEAIIAKSNGLLRYGGSKKSAQRIQRVDPDKEVPAEQILKFIEDAGLAVEQVISPGTSDSKSSKYNTFVVKPATQEEALGAFVVFGHGQNEGQKYEDRVIGDLKSSKEGKSEPTELYKLILKAFNIRPEQLVDIQKGSDKRVRRPVTDEINDVGAMISDINIIYQTDAGEQKQFFVSLKNENGATFANSGYGTGFDVFEENGEYVVKPGSHELDGFVVGALGIDKEKAAEGLTAYAQGKSQEGDVKSWEEIDSAALDPEKIKRYLASAYGYGYWYIRPRRKGGFTMYNLADEKSAIDNVGEIEKVSVRYPYYKVGLNKKGKQVGSKSKQISVRIETTKAIFLVEVRNSQGKIRPNEVKIKILKTKT